jgi:parallel beta-helix repeat protein
VGIERNGSGDVAIRRNRVYRSFTNISLGFFLLTAGPAPVVRVRDNVVLSGVYGIGVSTDGAMIRDNQASGNVYGLFAFSESAGNTFRDNDARYNLQTDCRDQTSDNAATVDNTWTDNQGFTSDPSGLCGAP